MLVPAVLSQPTLQPESDERSPDLWRPLAPASHRYPALLELGHYNAAGVQYCFAIKRKGLKVFSDNASPISEYL